MQWDDVAALAPAYPGAVIAPSYGTPSLKVRQKLLVRLRPEDDSLVLIEVPQEERAMLIAANPAVFHITPHYDGYPTILARLSVLDAAQLRYFLDRRYRAIAGKRLLDEWTKSA